MAARFPRRARLLKPEAFKQVFENGRREHLPLLTAVVSRGTQGHARIGLAVARKAVPLSVDRNRIKRQTRESFRLNLHRLPDCDIVILARPAAARAENSQLAGELAKLWTRIADRWPTCAPSISPAS